MNRKEELQALKARVEAVKGRLYSLERGIREIEQRPGVSLFRAVIDQEKCIGCGICQETCPVGAIALTEKARVDPARCIGCGRCTEACPQEAVFLQPADTNHRRHGRLG